MRRTKMFNIYRQMKNTKFLLTTYFYIISYNKKYSKNIKFNIFITNIYNNDVIKCIIYYY